jgi:RNA-directed DNA polymerase
LAQCHANCLDYAWVIDVDIKGFFDNISHEKLMELLKLHTQEKWILLYVERWLKAGVEQEDGSILERTKGTPQGGVISPLLANLYLHHAFDKWMDQSNASNPLNVMQMTSLFIAAVRSRQKSYWQHWKAR